MKGKTIPAMILTLILISILTATFNIKPAMAETWENNTEQIQIEPEPIYVGIAKYYDDRKCVVTSSQDDLYTNTSSWHNCLSMLTEKKIHHTISIITNLTDWNFVQYWVNQGCTEAASHSRNHVHAPYIGTDPYNGRARISYEWQINGSKNDIIGNVTLPNWWRSGNKEYVYAWIEPFGSSDVTVRQWLGDTHYLGDRGISSGIYDLALWDSKNELFNRIGYTVEMGRPPWGGDSSVSSLNSKFNTAYTNSKIYHFMTHPVHVDWSNGSYADQHTDYICNRTDVWYVPLGLLYLYHWAKVRNVTNTTSTGSGENKVFKISINETSHLNYGVSYPITHVFDIPSDWTSGYVYYRYSTTQPWALMTNKNREEFFNGINASRFDFTSHKAYVSVGFNNVSHNIYLHLRCTPLVLDATVDFPIYGLNLASKGKRISSYIEVPEGYKVNEINVSTMLLNNTVPVDVKSPVTFGDYDNDTISDLTVYFDRAKVSSYVLANINVSKLVERRFMTITLTVTGKLNDGTPFQGSDTVKITMLTQEKKESTLTEEPLAIFICFSSTEEELFELNQKSTQTSRT